MDAILKASLPKLREKLLEALQAVLPIVAIVLVLCFTIAPVSPSILLCFLLGAVLIVVGIMFFTLGAEMSMTPMGERVGAVLTRSRKLPVILGVGFLLGFLITISEPDLQVLANQVPSIPNQTLIFSVAAGVGLFLTVAFLRMLLGVALPPLLVAFYGLVFALAAFVPREFLAVAFDSGGVTTGPMTVPFIMALGVGVSAIRGDRHAADDSFGLVALCSVGPILAVLILGIAFRASDSTYIPPVLPEVSDSVELWQLFHEGLPEYIKEIASSLLPIVVMFGVFQAVALRLDKRTLGRIAVGLAYTYVGLVLFLTGANVGFMPAGNYLGQVLTGQSYRWVIIPIGMLIGYFIVRAEPAVYVLNKQVEEVTDGAISAQAMGMALSAGVSISVGLAMVRVLTGISILWFLIPGYAVAIGISFVVPKLFTAIAFDAGGVASGPMTATFLLPLAQGACVAVGGNIVTDAFGVVAMVAMTPLITVQLMGLAAQLKTGRRRAARAAEPALAGVAASYILLVTYEVVWLGGDSFFPELSSRLFAMPYTEKVFKADGFYFYLVCLLLAWGWAYAKYWRFAWGETIPRKKRFFVISAMGLTALAIAALLLRYKYLVVFFAVPFSVVIARFFAVATASQRTAMRWYLVAVAGLGLLFFK